MTRQTGVIDLTSFSTDAKFRTWGLACSTALQACGLVKTSDTGQINWASVAKPTATNTQAGYEIYRFADTLQATKPVYIRIGYGSGAVASGNSPSTWITIGTGTDGAGTITGPSTGAIQGMQMASTPTNATTPYYFTHTTDANGGYVLMMFGIGAVTGSITNQAGSYVIERTKNTAGAATGDGISFKKLGGTSADYGINFTTATAFTTGRNPIGALPLTAISMASGNSVPLGKHFAAIPNAYPLAGTFTYFGTDIATSSTFTATPLGAVTHTYLTFGSAYFSGYDSALTSGMGAAFIWED